MRITYKKTITFMVLKKIKRLKNNVILRSDISNLAQPRQISRALKRLIQQGIIEKIGYGVYAKLTRSEIAQTTYLKNGVLPTLREALSRLRIRWEPSDEERAYQTGRSTQIPVNPTTKIKDRFRRQLSYREMELTRG